MEHRLGGQTAAYLNPAQVGDEEDAEACEGHHDALERGQGERWGGLSQTYRVTCPDGKELGEDFF